MRTDEQMALSESDRRIARLLQFGTITEVDPAAARIRVSLGGEAVSGWVPWVAGRAGDVRVFSAPSVGEQVMLLSPSGSSAQAVALLGIYSQAGAAPAGEEGVTRVELPGGVSLDIRGGVVSLVAPGGVQITGDVTVAGDVVADGVSLKNHRHGGILRGGSQTDPPAS